MNRCGPWFDCCWTNCISDTGDCQEMAAMTELSKAVDLNELQLAVEKLVSLLKDRHPGLVTWNEALWDCIQNIDKIYYGRGR